MKHSLSISLASLVVTLGVWPAPLHAADPRPGYIDLNQYVSAHDVTEFVEVRVGRPLISMVTRLAGEREPEVADALRDLHQVQVNVMELPEEHREKILSDVANLRQELSQRGWETVVTVRNASEEVDIQLKLKEDEAIEGLAVSVIEKQRRLVLVNIVGDIRPEKIALIGERFHIEPLRKIGRDWAPQK